VLIKACISQIGQPSTGTLRTTCAHKLSGDVLFRTHVTADPTYGTYTAACNTDAWDPATNTQLWQFRSDPFNTSRYLLTPYGSDPSNQSPQCVTTCFTSSDTNCTANGRITAYGTTTEARAIFTELCDQIQQYPSGTKDYDTGEALELLPGAVGAHSGLHHALQSILAQWICCTMACLHRPRCRCRCASAPARGAIPFCTLF